MRSPDQAHIIHALTNPESRLDLWVRVKIAGLQHDAFRKITREQYIEVLGKLHQEAMEAKS